MNTPQTVKELNAAIVSTFNVLEYSRAYIELPLYIQINGEDMLIMNRIVMAVLALKGTEDLCCKQIWESLVGSVSRPEIEDACALLIMRSWFIYDSDNQILYGRVAFQKKQYHEHLLQERCYKKEGYAVVEALRERE